MVSADTIPDELGMPNRIRQLRDARDWSLEELAARASISLHQLSRIELGANTKLHTLIRIADALEVSLVALFADESDMDAAEIEAVRILKRLPVEDRSRAVQVLRAFLPSDRKH